MSEQKKTPTIEEAFNKQLAGESLKNGLNFAAFMQEHKFILKGKGANWNVDSTCWKLLFRGKIYATILIEQNQTFGVYCDFDKSFQVNDDLKKSVLAKIPVCPQEACKRNNHLCKSSITDYEILGTKHERVCHCPIQFSNPDAKDIDTIQKIMLLYKDKVLTQGKK